MGREAEGREKERGRERRKEGGGIKEWGERGW